MKKRLLAAVLAVMMLSSFAVGITAMARASDYITRTTAGLSSPSTGKVSLSYSVLATGRMPTVGVSSFYVEVKYGTGSWEFFKVFEAVDYPSMLGSNKVSHVGTFTFDGTPGAQYKGTVNSYASDANGHDYSQLQVLAVTCK